LTTGRRVRGRREEEENSKRRQTNEFALRLYLNTTGKERELNDD
jgi:hypothetical protein